MFTSAIVLSECIKIKRETAIFHFKGFFNGFKVTRIEIKIDKSSIIFRESEIYLLFVKIKSLKESNLNCEVLKYFTLDEIRNCENFNSEYEHLLNHPP